MKIHSAIVLGVLMVWSLVSVAEPDLQVGDSVTLSYDAFGHATHFNILKRPFLKKNKTLSLQNQSCHFTTGMKGVIESRVNFYRESLGKTFTTTVLKVTFPSYSTLIGCSLMFVKNPMFNKVFQHHSDDYRLIQAVDLMGGDEFHARNKMNSNIEAQFIEPQQAGLLPGLLSSRSEEMVFYRVPQVQCMHEGMGCYPKINVALSVRERSEVSSDTLSEMFLGLSYYDYYSVFVIKK